jgi:hypothetical protein
MKLCNFLHSPVTSSLLGPNILLKTLFSNTLSLCTSLSMRDQVSHPYKTTGRIVVLYIFNFYIPSHSSGYDVLSRNAVLIINVEGMTCIAWRNCLTGQLTVLPVVYSSRVGIGMNVF